MVYDPRLKYISRRHSASVFKRVVAFMIDLLMINLLTLPLQLSLISMLPASKGLLEDIKSLQSALSTNQSIYLCILLMSLIALLYFSIFEYTTGQTVGKRIMNLRVISDTPNLSAMQCITRNLFVVAMVPFTLIMIIDPIYMFFNPQRQRFTEMLSRTRVVEI